VVTTKKKQCKSIRGERRKMVEREQIRTRGRRKEDTGRHEEKVLVGAKL
jgi:hypothetical protein